MAKGKQAKSVEPVREKVFISEADQYLFGQGTHYDIYKKLGAHISVENGREGVYFAVWAPNAIRVSVVGDFNHWDGRIHQMRRLWDSGIFEIFIPILLPRLAGFLIIG